MVFSVKAVGNCIGKVKVLGICDGARVMSITEFAVLSPQECEIVASQVYELKEFWVKQHPSLPAFTLGASIGNEDNLDLYNSDVERCNPILLHNFKWLYEKLVAILQQYLKADVTYEHPFGLPGFIIYLAPKVATETRPPIHYDFQWRDFNLNFHYKTVNIRTSTSLTLPILLPKKTTGLNYWTTDFEQYVKQVKTNPLPPFLPQIGQSPQKKYHPYTIGNIVMHSAYTLHQAALPDPEHWLADNARIVLQIHTIQCDNQWLLYF